METEQAYTVDDRGNVAQFYEVESGDIVATINREDDVDGVPDQSTWDGGEHVTAWAIANGYPEVATMTELFQIEPVLSPRLKWMREHGIILTKFGADDHPTPWRASDGGSEKGYGDTEDSALVELAKKLNLRLWNEV